MGSRCDAKLPDAPRQRNGKIIASAHKKCMTPPRKKVHTITRTLPLAWVASANAFSFVPAYLTAGCVVQLPLDYFSRTGIDKLLRNFYPMAANLSRRSVVWPQ